MTKDKITISIDHNILHQIDELVKSRQRENLSKNEPLTNRSEVIETIVRELLKRK